MIDDVVELGLNKEASMAALLISAATLIAPGASPAAGQAGGASDGFSTSGRVTILFREQS
jgi:hypothetical protein